MTNFRIGVLIVVVALLAGTAGYITRIARDPAPGVATASAQVQSKPLTHWAFEDLNGESQHLSNWSGKFLVINFWATWCPPCLKEIPSFVRLQQAYQNQGIQFIGIALDRVDAVTTYAEKAGINYPVLIGGDNVAEFMRDLGNKIGALPFTAVIDRSGNIVKSHQGEWHEAPAEEFLRANLD